MATVMASPRRPSLPAGNLQAQSNVTHVRIGHESHQSNHQSQDTAPPLPSRPIRRQAIETKSFIDRNTAKAYSDPSTHRHVERSQSESSQHHYQQQQHSAHAGSFHSHGQTTAQSAVHQRQRQPKTNDVPPPPPSSRPPTRPPPQYETAPPPPPVSRPPARKQQSQTNQSAPAQPLPPAHTTKRQLNTQEVPPALPPARPPKTSHSSNSSIESVHTGVPGRPPKSQLHSAHSVEEHPHLKHSKSGVQSPVATDDFESRFRFHNPSDFPEPETTDVSTKKSYFSQSVSVKKKSRKAQDD
ncbi:uncharacterized protein LOC123551319 [Mercenaria mercenaria]|uniref:uncharacterized protein LOC123551319 n=1 Tax=Mercenaria mercenaria TaxID=6596 RepID=UPI00234F4549|nr:uncharacterized protein LOC123551319 [Mercenaria mercenaria]XP_045196118.2 uncharacterized protein LOC123551319 [Mercenaria mercenaria]